MGRKVLQSVSSLAPGLLPDSLTAGFGAKEVPSASTYCFAIVVISPADACGNLTVSCASNAEIIGCTAGEIHDRLATQMMGSKLWDKNTNNEIINQLLGMAVAWNIEDRIAIENQVGLLKQAQGGTYRAFISSEVNKALGLKISASNSLQSLIKSLTSGGTINIFNQQNNNTQINSSHITVEQAIDIVQNQLNESNHEPRGYIEGTYAMEELPEVVATKQVGISTAKEGLTIKKRDIIGAIDDYKGAIAEADNVHHETRREIAELIDTYDDDPEADLY